MGFTRQQEIERFKRTNSGIFKETSSGIHQIAGPVGTNTTEINNAAKFIARPVSPPPSEEEDLGIVRPAPEVTTPEPEVVPDAPSTPVVSNTVPHLAKQAAEKILNPNTDKSFKGDRSINELITAYARNYALSENNIRKAIEEVLRENIDDKAYADYVLEKVIGPGEKVLGTTYEPPTVEGPFGTTIYPEGGDPNAVVEPPPVVPGSGELDKDTDDILKKTEAYRYNLDGSINWEFTANAVLNNKHLFTAGQILNVTLKGLPTAFKTIGQGEDEVFRTPEDAEEARKKYRPAEPPKVIVGDTDDTDEDDTDDSDVDLRALYKDQSQLYKAWEAGTINDKQAEEWLRTARNFSAKEILNIISGWKKVRGDKPSETTTDIDETERGEPGYSIGSYSSAPWSPIYQDYLRKNFGGGNPFMNQFVSQQGLSGDPLRRTAWTQFLLQEAEDDPWDGDIQGQTITSSGATPGRLYGGRSDNPNANPYNDFLDDYKPLEGDALLKKINEVVGFLETGGPTKDFDFNEQYTDEELAGYRWQQRFGMTSPNSDQNQQALAALPIMQKTPVTLQNETSSILKRLHDQWVANPNTDRDEGWLQYVVRNNYFGMIGDVTQYATPSMDVGSTGDYLTI